MDNSTTVVLIGTFCEGNMDRQPTILTYTEERGLRAFNIPRITKGKFPDGAHIRITIEDYPYSS